IGMIAGVVSSILLASPLLVDFKMRESKYREHKAKVERRRERAAAGESAELGDDSAADTAERSTSGGPEVTATTSGSSARGTRGKRDNRPSAKSRPSGKSGRPSGKKRR